MLKFSREALRAQRILAGYKAMEDVPTGYSGSWLGRREYDGSNAVTPTPADLKLLADIYGCDYSDFFVNTEEKHMEINYKYKEHPCQNFEQHGDWIDLQTPYPITAEKGELVNVPLNFALQLPEGYEAILAPRSSTFPKYGLILGNSIGVIDNGYSGPEDYWQANFYATRDIGIPAGTRLLQFRLIPTTHHLLGDISFKENPEAFLNTKNRGGFGSSGN